jgi:RIO-like serine/threonine protein kinase
MMTAQLAPGDRRVLRAVERLERSGHVVNTSGITALSGLVFAEVWRAVNRLHAAGLLTPSLGLTDKGRAELGG